MKATEFRSQLLQLPFERNDLFVELLGRLDECAYEV